MTKKSKYIMALVVAAICFVVAGMAFANALNRNPEYSCEDVFVKTIENLFNTEYKKGPMDILYTTKIDGSLSIIENIYNVWNIEFCRYLEKLGADNPSVTSENLHREYIKLVEEHSWNSTIAGNCIEPFNENIRCVYGIMGLDSLEDTGGNILAGKETEGKSFYLKYTSFKNKYNSDEKYILVDVFMQNSDTFVYCSYFMRGEVHGYARNDILTDDFEKKFEAFFSDFENRKVNMTVGLGL